jgi:hypothetical protein
VYTPEPTYSPPVVEAEPEAASVPARKTKPKGKAKAKARPKRKPAAKRAQPARQPEPALRAVPLIEERRLLVASALPQGSYSPPDEGAPYPLFLLAFGGVLLLGVAGAAPRLAWYWPGVFVPVTRERDALSFFGLCLLASGVLAWAIAGGGI